MWVKMGVAIAMPFVMAAGVGAVLETTHHTKIPPLSIPAMRSAPQSPSPAGATPTLTTYEKACLGQLPRRFAGIAMKKVRAAHVTQFQQLTGAKIRVVEFYTPFPGSFPMTAASGIAKVGALPLIQLNPRKVKMRDIASGKYDSVIKSYALNVKAFACHVVLSLGHEMNGWWYPWGMPWTKPSTYIAAWRRIHDIFSAEGVTNVIWSWDPSHQYAPSKSGIAYPASEWYPGKRYVDWIGLDGYLNPGQNFTGVFADQLASIRSVAPHKPIYLAETAVAPNPYAVLQIADLFAGLKRNHLRGLIWFDQKAKHDWALKDRKPAIAEFGKFVTRFR